ncbi:hypothetical protein CBM2637_B70013 [Cupriavidus taiwanensis]|nr:hypothetical protein CBM2637_B70013 [Cupriavidus taiwanensis]
MHTSSAVGRLSETCWTIAESGHIFGGAKRGSWLVGLAPRRVNRLRNFWRRTGLCEPDGFVVAPALTPAPLPQAGEGSKQAGGNTLLGSHATARCERSDALRARAVDRR